MITHAVQPDRFLRHLRSRLRTGGFLYLRHEADDRRMMAQRENLIGELRPFHFQQFDRPALSRAVTSAGFKVVFSGHKHPESRKSEMVLIGQKTDDAGAADAMSADERAERLAMYRGWYDESVLALGDVAVEVAEDYEALAARLVADGRAERNAAGAVLREPMKMLHMEH
jgi:hypothetical protein